jgi:acetyl esterase
MLDRNMPVQLADAELTSFLRDLQAHAAPPAAAVGAPALREAARQRARARPRGPEMSDVRDVATPGGHARLYLPDPEAHALVLYLHGGGWVIGDLETHDRACRRLAARARAAVLALDYRRAPEHPWPAAVDDAVAALRWIHTRPAELAIAPAAVAIAGDSAGGTTATLACLRIRTEQPAALPDLQVLVYANTDLSGPAGSGDSVRDKAHGFGLEVEDIAWFNAQWVPDPAMRSDPRVSPLLDPHLEGSPRAIVVTCEHDPLRDQGEAYAARLREAGVHTALRREPGMVHNFLLWDTVSPACAAAADRVADDIAAALGTRDSAQRGSTRR